MILDHPRPQFMRDAFISLDGSWGFAVDATAEGVREHWFERAEPFRRSILVPFPPESPASGIGEDVDAALWYRREFDHEPREGERLLLHFEGVDHAASVWVNGRHVADHEGSQSRFSVDLTDVVVAGVNALVVRAVDGHSLEQPRGKQDWRPEPHAIWYRRTSGIWRSVWLERVPELRLDRLVLTPEDDLASVRFEARLAGRFEPGLRLELEFSRDGVVLSSTSHAFVGDVVRGTPVLVHPGLGVQPEELWWTPETPVLIDVAARLVRDDEVVDRVASYVGLRTVSTDASHVLLNGRRYFLRLVLEQAYWPETHLASPSLEALVREAELIKELGFNGLRMHQTSADPRFLAVCDRIGLVVLADCAAAYEFSELALSRTVAEVTGLVRRDAAHPCLIGWVPFNESWGLPNLPTDAAQREAVRALTSLLKALDPSRLVIGNDGWEFVAGDLVGVHDYTQSGEALRERYGSLEAARRTILQDRPGNRVVVVPGSEGCAEGVPVILSEFGGLSAHEADDAWEAYGEVLAPEELARRLAEMVAEVGPASGLAGFCYTQLTDTAQEMNGLLTENRDAKCPPELFRAALGAD
ncbi:MAG: glycoside hydrolase family 2 TIM barrel-domain containing protein [Protaetiibacter sp.]